MTKIISAVRAPFWSAFLIVQIAIAVVSIPIMNAFGVFDPLPYRSVHVREPIKLVGENKVKIVADFYKSDCDYQALVVVGRSISGWSKPLPWVDVDERDPPEYNRTVGDQTLRIMVDMRRNTYDELQIRTRHLCPDEDEDGNPIEVVVNRIFATVDVPPLAK